MKKINKAIENFLNKRGYFKSDMPEGSSLSESEVIELFNSYGQNETLLRFLRDLCARDIRLYFQATNDVDRNSIRGGWGRTNYFISLIQKSNDKRKRSK